MVGMPDPMEVGKPYKAGHYKCTRFDIDKDEDKIIAKKNVIVKQVGQTNVFATIQDAVNFLAREGDAKDKYYGVVLQKTSPTVFA